MNNSEISKNIFELYKIMFNLANSEQGKNIFSKEMLKLTKIPVEDVEGALLSNNEIKATSKNDIRQEIKNLDTNKAVIQYFNDNIGNSFALNEQEIINSFSAKELKLIYSKIVGIEIVSKSITKVEIVSKIIDFLNSEIRANDLAKDLF